MGVAPCLDDAPAMNTQVSDKGTRRTMGREIAMFNHTTEAVTWIMPERGMQRPHQPLTIVLQHPGAFVGRLQIAQTKNLSLL